MQVDVGNQCNWGCGGDSKYMFWLGNIIYTLLSLTQTPSWSNWGSGLYNLFSDSPMLVNFISFILLFQFFKHTLAQTGASLDIYHSIATGVEKLFPSAICSRCLCCCFLLIMQLSPNYPTTVGCWLRSDSCSIRDLTFLPLLFLPYFGSATLQGIVALCHVENLA